jgi:hypothetical protein
MLSRLFHALTLAGLGLAVSLPAAQSARADDDDVAAMNFTIAAAGEDCHGCVVINAKGEITDDTSRDFAVFLAESRLKGLLPKEAQRSAQKPANAPRVIIGFESIGGKVVPALVIGRRIRQLGWTTVVGQAVRTKTGPVFQSAGCYSACSMIMLGGVERYVVPGSKPGVHQFSPQFNDKDTFSAADMNAIVRDYARQVVGVYDYVQEMGVDNSFFIATMRTPFLGMDVLSQERWTKLGLATGMLPNAKETPVSAVLGAMSAVKPQEPTQANAPHEDDRSMPIQPVAATSELTNGMWTVAHSSAGPFEAQFSDRSVSLSLACLRSDTARLDLTFKELGPVELERVRAAAFATMRLGFGERQIAIASVAEPGRGEQALGALLDMHDVKALQDADALTFAVLDRTGKPVAKGASVSAAGAAKAIADAMTHCGGL